MFYLDKMLATRIQVLIILLKLLLSFANGNSEKLTKASDVNHQIATDSEVNPQTETNHQPTLALLVSVKPNGAQSGGDEITLASDELAGSKENRASMHDKLVQTLLDNGDAKTVNSFGQTSEEVMEKNHMENKHQELWDLLDALLKRKHELDKVVTKKDDYNNSDSLEDPDSAESKPATSHEYEEYDPPSYRHVKISKRKAQDDRKHHKDYSYDFYNFFSQSQTNLKNDKKYDMSDEDVTCEDSITDDQEYDSKEEKQRRNTIKISKIMDNGLKRVYQLELEAKKRKQENSNGRGKNYENESSPDLSSYEQTNLRSSYKRSSKETPVQDKIKNKRTKTAAEKKSKDKLKGFENSSAAPYEKLTKKQPKEINENLKQRKTLKRRRNNRFQNIENFSKENTLKLKTRRRPPLKYVNSAERKRLLDVSDCSEQILPKSFRDTKRTAELRRGNKDNDQNIKETTTNKFTLKKNPNRKKLANYDNFESDPKTIRRKPRQHGLYPLSDEDSFEELNEPKLDYINDFQKNRHKRSHKRRDRNQALDSSSSGEMEGQYSNYDIDRVDWSEFDQYLNPYDNFDRKIAEIFRRYDRGISSDIDNSYEYHEDKRKHKPKLIQVINEERNARPSVKDDKSSLENDETNQDAHAIRLSTDLENIMEDSKEFVAATEDIGTTLDKDIEKTTKKFTESPIYAKKGVRIPLKLVQDEDGNYNLQVDMKYLCKKCTKKCSKRKRGKKVEGKTT